MICRDTIYKDTLVLPRLSFIISCWYIEYLSSTKNDAGLWKSLTLPLMEFLIVPLSMTWRKYTEKFSSYVFRRTSPYYSVSYSTVLAWPSRHRSSTSHTNEHLIFDPAHSPFDPAHDLSTTSSSSAGGGHGDSTLNENGKRRGSPDRYDSAVGDIDVPYFLEYSLGLKLNPVLNWTRVNLPIQIEGLSLFKSRFQPSVDLNLGDYGPWN